MQIPFEDIETPTIETKPRKVFVLGNKMSYCAVYYLIQCNMYNTEIHRKAE